LIEACARVDDARFSCLIAGSGVREDALRALAVQRGAKNVRFLGRLSPTEIGTLMAAGDVHYVGLNDHPLARVTMPSKIQSTLASARPIIGSLKGDAARIVSGSSGWVVDPGDIDGLENAIRTASAAGRSKLAHMGGAARRVYEAEFSQSVGIDRIESLLGVAAQRCAAS
jgi:glycosyltransferase involved in cell wall biosynthesis